jgi:hypothetical protein
MLLAAGPVGWYIRNTRRTLSVPVLPLVTRRAYSQSLSSYWSHASSVHLICPRNAFSGWTCWLVHRNTRRTFSVPVLPLVTRREYSQSLSSHRSQVENILSPCPPIGHTSRIFSVPVLPLVTRREQSQSLSSHLSHVKNILSPCPPSGHTSRIFLVPVLPLVTRREQSQSLSSHLSHVKNILSPCPPSGHTSTTPANQSRRPSTWSSSINNNSSTRGIGTALVGAVLKSSSILQVLGLLHE